MVCFVLVCVNICCKCWTYIRKVFFKFICNIDFSGNYFAISVKERRGSCFFVIILFVIRLITSHGFFMSFMDLLNLRV